jgi:prepilin-type N-terminal cleavage/methylation domain-containing protein
MTLIELMIGLSIFGILFISLYGGISSGVGIIRTARENLRATQVMLEKMETIRLYSWDQLNQSGFIPTTFTSPYWPAETNSGLQYQGTLTITNVSFNEAYSSDMRQVTVTVSWYSGTIQHQRQMRTYVSRYGLQNYVY